MNILTVVPWQPIEMLMSKRHSLDDVLLNKFSGPRKLTTKIHLSFEIELAIAVQVLAVEGLLTRREEKACT